MHDEWWMPLVEQIMKGGEKMIKGLEKVQREKMGLRVQYEVVKWDGYIHACGMYGRYGG